MDKQLKGELGRQFISPNDYQQSIKFSGCTANVILLSRE